MREQELIDYIQGKADADTRRRVEAWAAASVENKRTLENLYCVSELERQLAVIDQVDVQRSLHKVKKSIHRQENQQKGFFQKRVFTISAVACSLLFLFFFSGYKLYQSVYNKPVRLLSIVNDQPFSQECRLADGSVVTLQPNSKLIYDEQFLSNREVTLEGQAFFKVAKKKDSRFVVHAKDSRIIVTGTTFVVSAYKNQDCIETSLYSGKISFEANQQQISIHPNQHLTYQTSQKKITLQNTAQEDFNGVVFNNEPLMNVIKTVMDLYDCSIVIRDRALLSSTYTGTIESHNAIEHILDVLTLTTNSTYAKKGTQWIITRQF